MKSPKMFKKFKKVEEVECLICRKKSKKISNSLPVCLECIRGKPDRALEISSRIHSKARKEKSLPTEVPKSSKGVECSYCANRCQIPLGNKGYCNLSKNEEGELVRKFGTSERAIGSWYRDLHQTNCVASWYCAGGSGYGYPEYARRPEGDRGFKSAAVFLGTCCYHCLYCQNEKWCKMASSKRSVLERDELAENIFYDRSITCLCWFGGSPEPQSPFVYEVSRNIARKAKKEDRIFRICLEANGNFSWSWLKKIAKLSLETGGGIKFDLKAWNEGLNRILSGVSNNPTYENFERLASFHSKRKEPPFLRASTPLIPGYVDLKEVRKISKFISEVDSTIPYSLLAYGPAYKLSDLPTTSEKFALEARDVAKEEGLENVRIGNKHLLL